MKVELDLSSPSLNGTAAYLISFLVLYLVGGAATHYGLFGDDIFTKIVWHGLSLAMSMVFAKKVEAHMQFCIESERVARGE